MTTTPDRGDPAGNSAAAQARFATLHFERAIAAPLATLWQAWTAPAARAVWSAPDPGTTVAIGRPDIGCESTWLALEPEARAVNAEIVRSAGADRSAALVTAEFAARGPASHLAVTVQLVTLSGDEVESEYRHGFEAGLDRLFEVAARTMVLQRRIRAPRERVWEAWMDARNLPQWWGPEGFTCRTARIDLREGGEWVFDMIGPDGTIYPNHHRYHTVRPQERIGYELLWGENGPKHADAWASLDARGGETVVTLGMVFSSAAEFQTAKGFGAIELGQETLGKLERFALTGR